MASLHLTNSPSATSEVAPNKHNEGKDGVSQPLFEGFSINFSPLYSCIHDSGDLTIYYGIRIIDPGFQVGVFLYL